MVFQSFFHIQLFPMFFKVQIFQGPGFQVFQGFQGPSPGSRVRVQVLKVATSEYFCIAYIRWVRKTNDSFFLGRLRQKDVKVTLKFIHDFSSFMKFDKSASIRSSHSQLLFKLGALKNFANFKGKPLCRGLFLIKL